MSFATDAEQDRSSGVDAPRFTAPWRVTSVTPLEGQTLAVTFVDGTTGIVRLSGLINSEGAGVFAALRDPAVFAAVYVDFGVVTWPGELDLAPDAMYDEIRANGEWVIEGLAS